LHVLPSLQGGRFLLFSGDRLQFLSPVSELLVDFLVRFNPFPPFLLYFPIWTVDSLLPRSSDPVRRNNQSFQYLRSPPFRYLPRDLKFCEISPRLSGPVIKNLPLPRHPPVYPPSLGSPLPDSPLCEHENNLITLVVIGTPLDVQIWIFYTETPPLSSCLKCPLSSIQPLPPPIIFFL